MFASLFDCLLQTFIASVTAVFAVIISHFMQASGDTVKVILDGLIGCITEYVSAAICDICFTNNGGILPCGIDVGFAMVCEFFAMIHNQYNHVCLYNINFKD